MGVNIHKPPRAMNAASQKGAQRRINYLTTKFVISSAVPVKRS
jgi:hypothetical protein